MSTSSINRKSFKALNCVLEAPNVIDMLDSFETSDFDNDNFYNVIANINEETLYTCLHTWIRNRRLEGLMKFAKDVAEIIIKSEDINEDSRSSYIKKEMLSVFKDFLRYNYPKRYELSDKYELYKYDLMIVGSAYNPYEISYEIKLYREMYEDDEFDGRDIYYEDNYQYYDEYECFMDMYNEVENSRF